MNNEKEISIKVINSSNEDDKGQFYWSLFMKYLNLYDNPTFSVSYIIVKNNKYMIQSVEFNLLTDSLQDILDSLHNLESIDDFIGFQVI